MIFEKLQYLKEQKTSFCLITLIKIKGSAPQQTGAKCIVTKDGLYFGTIGGGKLEAQTILTAQEIIQNNTETPLIKEWNLQRDIKMTCGGEVSLLFEYFNFNKWPIVIFGAGHVAQALVRTLENLDCNIQCFDNRDIWIEKFDGRKNCKLVNDMPSIVKDLHSNSYFICITQGHATDLPILEQIYKHHPCAPYVGAIGSAAKALTLKKELKERQVSEEFINKLHLPIGLPIGKSQPYEIAISITAQLLEQRDLYAK